MSGQSRGSACSLLAGGSKDTEVFSRPKTYTFIFKDLLLRRALFLQEQIPTSAKKLFQAFCKETSGQRGLQSISPFTHICMGEANVPCVQDEQGAHSFWPRWPSPGIPQSRNPTPISPSLTHMKGGKATAASCFCSVLKINYYSQSK